MDPNLLSMSSDELLEMFAAHEGCPYPGDCEYEHETIKEKCDAERRELDLISASLKAVCEESSALEPEQKRKLNFYAMVLQHRAFHAFENSFASDPQVAA